MKQINAASDSSSGTTVTATCGNSSKAIRIVVVEVQSVSTEGVTSETNTPGSEETVYLAKGEPGDTITITATPTPLSTWPNYQPIWTNASATATPGEATFPIDSVSSTANGTTVTAFCGSSSVAIKIVVVGVEKIQYKLGTDSYADAPNELVVAKGADVTFKAIQTPSGVDWPDGTPEWSGSSGASGTGEEKEVGFDTASSTPTDYKEVIANCGDSEETVNVVVVDLSQLSVDAKRTSNPTELTYPVKSGEHFECGGTFQFDLNLNDGTYTWPQPIKMGAEIWELELLHEQIASGTGISITYTFGDAATTHDDGECLTRFYFDNNTSGDSKTGSDDPKLDTSRYLVKDLKEHSLTFAHSSAVSPTIAGGPDYAGVSADQSERILQKDATDDWRATGKFTVSSIGSVVPEMDTSVTPNEDRDAFRYVHGSFLNLDIDHFGDIAYYQSKSPADIYVVDEIEMYNTSYVLQKSLAGVCFYHTDAIFIDQEYFTTSYPTLAHEMGHRLGITGDYTDPGFIMHYQAGDYRKLKSDEDDNYE